MVSVNVISNLVSEENFESYEWISCEKLIKKLILIIMINNNN